MPDDVVVGVKMVSRFDDHYYAVELLNGEIVYIPSVTTYLQALNKEWLPRFRGDVGNREADLRLSEAADRGSRIHHACYIYATGGVVMFEYAPEMNHPEAVELRNRNAMVVQQCDAKGIRWYKLYRQAEMEQFGRFVKWIQTVNPEIICAEQVFWSLEDEMAGTLDYVMRIPEGSYEVNGSKPVYLRGVYVVDVKTGAAWDQSYYLQMSGYKRLYEMRRNTVLAGTIGLHLNSSTKRGIAGLATYVSEPSENEEYYKRLLEIRNIWKFQHPNALPTVGEFISIAARETVESDLVFGGIEPATEKDVVKEEPKAEAAGTELELTPPPASGEPNGHKGRKPTKATK